MKYKAVLKIIVLMSIYYPTMVWSATLGTAAGQIFTGANLLVKFLWAGCILAGIFLLVGCMVNYQAHRNNPKLVPLSTVITYLLAGLSIISIPFLNRIFGADAYDIATKPPRVESAHKN